MKTMKRSFLIVLAIMMMLSSIVSCASAAISPSPFNIANAKVDVRKATGVYNGDTQSARLVIIMNGIRLEEGKDFVISGNETSGISAKKYQLNITIQGLGAYYGEKNINVSYKIRRASQTIDATSRTKTVAKRDLRSHSVAFRTGARSSSRKLALINRTGTGFTMTSTGIIRIPRGTKAGKYRLFIRAPRTDCYKPSHLIRVIITVK